MLGAAYYVVDEAQTGRLTAEVVHNLAEHSRSVLLAKVQQLIL